MTDQDQMLHDGRSMRERMLACDLYISDDPQPALDNRREITLMHRFNTSDPADHAAQLAVLRELLGSLGVAAFIRAPLWCDYGTQIQIGNGVTQPNITQPCHASG